MIEKRLKLPYNIPNEIVTLIIQHYPEPFTFIKNDKLVIEDDDCIQIFDDGLSMTQQKIGWVITQIGPFVHKSEGVLVTLVIKYIEEEPGRAAVGFMTSEFDEWTVKRTCNTGSNHTCMIYGDAILVTTKNDFSSEHDVFNCRSLDMFKENRLFSCGDKICIQIDMIKRIGRIWNDKDDQAVFTVSFKSDLITFCVLGGEDKHKFSIVSQTFVYDKC